MVRHSANGGGLAGIRVLDLGQYLAGPLAAMMLADFGAEVIRVDPPGGPRWDHAANATLQRNKRSIILDLKKADDLDFARELISTVDVVIEGFRPGAMARLGLDPGEICGRAPDLIWCSVPGFGHDDPRANIGAYEGILCSAASLYPPRMFAKSGGPRFSAIPYASNFGGFIAAHSIVAALIARHRFGHGDRIEVPLFDAAMEGLAISLEDPPSDPIERIMGIVNGTGIKNPADQRLYKGRDGRFIRRDIPNRGKHNFWDKLMPEGLKNDTSPEGARHAAQLLETLLGSKDAQEWEDYAQRELRAAFATHYTSAEWLHDRHALESQTAIVVDDPILGRTHQAGFGTRISSCPPAVRFGRRLPGADGAEIRAEVAAFVSNTGRTATKTECREGHRKPLDGIRVLDFASLVAGPGTSRILAEYGAECIKIAKTGVAYGKINLLSEEVGMLMGHRITAAGKKTMFVDLRTERGREIARGLAATADILCHNFAMGIAEEMGIGEAGIRQLSPDIVYATVNVHGRGGSRESYRGIEHHGQAVTGAMLRFGGRDTPEPVPILINDYGTPHLGALGILIAMFHKIRGGGGSTVEAALSRTATISQIPFMIDYEGCRRDEPTGSDAKGWNHFDRLFECADGWLYLAAAGSDKVACLKNVPGLEQLRDAEDGAIEPVLESAFKNATRAEWVARLSRAGVPAHIYLDLEDLLKQPILFERRMAILKEHPGMAPGRVIGIAARFASMPRRSVPAAARPGWHTVELLRELGYGVDQIDDLIDAEIVAGPMPEGSPIDAGAAREEGS